MSSSCSVKPRTDAVRTHRRLKCTIPGWWKRSGERVSRADRMRRTVARTTCVRCDDHPGPSPESPHETPYVVAENGVDCPSRRFPTRRRSRSRGQAEGPQPSSVRHLVRIGVKTITTTAPARHRHSPCGTLNLLYRGL